MAKTIIEYEASDIDIVNDPVHKLLYINAAVTVLMLTGMPKHLTTYSEKEEWMKGAAKSSIAAFLTAMAKDGYIITKKEEIPQAFLDA